MKYNPEIHHRRSIRLKGYDYSQPGAYFVTICVKNRECLFGEVSKGEMRLNEYGQIAHSCWEEIPKHFPHVEIDEFVIMPNHVHGIIVIKKKPIVGVQDFEPLQNEPLQNKYQRIIPCSLGSIIRGYKVGVTKLCRGNGNPIFQWQRNYYEHTIRNEDKLNRIREYIKNNPLKWHLDRENPQRTGNDPLEVEVFGKGMNRLVKARPV